MTNDQLKESLIFMGMSKKDFAECIGVKQQTVNSWTSKGIPYWVEPFLSCMKDRYNLQVNINKEVSKFIVGDVDDDIIIEAHYQMMEKFRKSLTPLGRFELAMEDIDMATMYAAKAAEELSKTHPQPTPFPISS